ncbi:hypothetical protein V6N12_035351 [Hibiscus sabdariffa]|uniref:Uncharacterized protein n=1 Tax=Hibiscus sabdariffa TaxID=183260 RepID=A0ABR2BSC1_9ROSI
MGLASFYCIDEAGEFLVGRVRGDPTFDDEDLRVGPLTTFKKLNINARDCSCEDGFFARTAAVKSTAIVDLFPRDIQL